MAVPLLSISLSLKRRARLSPHRGSRLPFCLILLALCAMRLPAEQSPMQLVVAMVHNEQQARAGRTLFQYNSEERSTRTGGHLWREKVVEMPDGLLRRLIAEDGKPLPVDRAAAEDKRITALVSNPDSFRAENADRRADEARMAKLLDILPKAFLLSPEGMQGDCIRIGYRPNPDFSPSTYDERIAHALAGTVAIQKDTERLCSIDGHLVDRVNFGYGLLGHLEKDGRFALTRKQVTQVDWKSSHISVHMDGKILMLKSIARDEEATHSDEQALPAGLTLAQAAALTRPVAAR